MGDYCVYKHTSPSGKVYIGITCQNSPKNRWDRGRGYMHNYHFVNAVRKYGWDCIKHEIVYTGLTCEEASNAEIELIKQYNSTNRKCGYNLSPGGGGHSVESRTTMSKNLTKLWKNNQWREDRKQAIKRGVNTDEHRIVLSQNAKRQWENPEQQKLMSKKISAAWKDDGKRSKWVSAMKARWNTDEGRRAQYLATKKQWRKVYCVETETTFECISDAGRNMGADPSAITKCCNKIPRYNTAGGYHWEWASEQVETNEMDGGGL